MVRRKKLDFRRNRQNQRNESRFPEEETEPTGEIDSDAERVEGDDCTVIVEEDCGYSEIELEIGEDVDEELNPQVSESQFVEVQIAEGFEEEFGNEAHEDNQSVDDDSGDDVWDDGKIPDLRSVSEDEFGNEARPFTRPREPDSILHLGKLFNNADEFKEALLRYSLKTQYDIVMYKSSSERLGAKCTKSEEEKCPWKCYCKLLLFKDRVCSLLKSCYFAFWE